jgi:hypothetical protein
MRIHPYAPTSLLIDVLNHGSLQGVLSAAYGRQNAPHNSGSDSSVSDASSGALSSLPSLRMRDDSSDNSSISSISTIPSEDSSDTDFWDAPLPSIFIGGAEDEEEHEERGGYDETDAWLDGLLEDGADEALPRARTRAPNKFAYENGDIFQSNYYRQFLCPAKRQRTYIESRDKDSRFRSHFRVPLDTVDQLTNLFIENEWVQPHRKCKEPHKFRTRTELMILCALEHLGNRKPHRQFKTHTELTHTIHQAFFRLFIDRMYSIKDEHIYFPRNMEELKEVITQYQEKDLPGACGSIDVVHVKWSKCPAGDFNKCKGKESFPSVAFECVTSHTRRVMGIAPIQYGTRNDKHIVRIDQTVKMIRFDWYKEVQWSSFDIHGRERISRGAYFICDGGYLRWPTLICPYAGDSVHGRKGYFNTNLESIRKDVECTFGILKKRWRILDYGFNYYCMKDCENVCCILHNMLLELGETFGYQVIAVRGQLFEGDGLWLEGPEELNERLADDAGLYPATIAAVDKRGALLWQARRDILVEHREYCKSIRR